MSTRENYAEGLSLGTLYADADRADHISFATRETELRAEANEAVLFALGYVPGKDPNRSWAAFKLGIVRGYRQVTRTQMDGRWGT